MTIAEIHAAKTILHEIATQANNLGMGLQNAAPPAAQVQKPGSIHYLLETAKQLEKASNELEKLFIWNTTHS